VGATLNGTSDTHFGIIFGASTYSDNNYYVPTSLKTVVVTGGNGIGDYAFWNCSGLTSITIPNGVTNIGESAFLGCANLSSIKIPFVGATLNGTSDTHFGAIFGAPTYSGNSSYIPSSLKTVSITGGNGIGPYAFWDCADLTSITIPNSVTSIGEYAFYNCGNLTSITIPNSVTSIGNYAFYGCSGLRYFSMPNAVTSIGNYAFYGCSGWTYLDIPSTVTSIGDYTFYGCSGLTYISIPSGVTSIGNYAFYGCSGSTYFCMPYAVTSVGDYAFYGCSGLLIITIPAGLTSIGFNAFSYCHRLESIYVESGNTIYKSENDCLIKIDDNTLVLGGKNSVIPDYVTGIAEYAFAGNDGLLSITLPAMTSIADYAFSDCGGLRLLKITGNITSIGQYAFSNCPNLYGVILESPVMIAISQSLLDNADITFYVPAALLEDYMDAYSGVNFEVGFGYTATFTLMHAYSCDPQIIDIDYQNPRHFMFQGFDQYFFQAEIAFAFVSGSGAEINTIWDLADILGNDIAAVIEFSADRDESYYTWHLAGDSFHMGEEYSEEYNGYCEYFEFDAYDYFSGEYFGRLRFNLSIAGSLIYYELSCEII
jgi:hypothetical protein